MRLPGRPRRLGDYELVRLIAQCGQGLVWLALQRSAGGGSVDKDQMWEDFRHRVEASISKRSAPVDLGMDRGI